MTTPSRPRRFGRARHLTARKRATQRLYELAYRGGWPSRVARLLGLTGTLGVAEQSLTIAARSAGGRSLRVGFASDLHAGPSTHPALVARACRALADARPALLLLGGDLASFHARDVASLVAPLAAIEAPLGKFAVPGNHDLIPDDASIAAQLAEAGVRTLVNESVRLAAPYDDVWVCGLDDPTEGTPNAEAAFAGAAGTRLVLMHSPEGLRWLAGHDYAAAFCGHVHGGQFWLRGRPIVQHKGALDRHYVRGGVFPPEDGRAGTLLVSRGIGQTTLPFRRHADPEVHVITIELRA